MMRLLQGTAVLGSVVACHVLYPVARETATVLEKAFGSSSLPYRMMGLYQEFLSTSLSCFQWVLGTEYRI